ELVAPSQAARQRGLGVRAQHEAPRRAGAAELDAPVVLARATREPLESGHLDGGAGLAREVGRDAGPQGLQIVHLEAATVAHRKTGRSPISGRCGDEDAPKSLRFRVAWRVLSQGACSASTIRRPGLVTGRARRS